MSSIGRSDKGLLAIFQPAIAWVAIAMFVLLSGLFTVTGLSKLLNLLFPIGAVSVGLLLFFRAPFSASVKVLEWLSPGSFGSGDQGSSWCDTLGVLGDWISSTKIP